MNGPTARHDPDERLSEQDIESLLDPARAGAEWAWSRLYEGLAPSIRAYARHRGAADPDDVVGETFVHLARGLTSFEGSGAGFLSWVFTVAHSRVVDSYRSASRRPSVAVDPIELVDVRASPVADGPAARTQSAAGIERLLDVLTEEQRAVIVHRVLADQTISQTATTLGKPITAIKSLQRRALSTMRRALTEVDRDGAAAILELRPTRTGSVQP